LCSLGTYMLTGFLDIKSERERLQTVMSPSSVPSIQTSTSSPPSLQALLNTHTVSHLFDSSVPSFFLINRIDVATLPFFPFSITNHSLH
jgi:hypothetical protein